MKLKKMFFFLLMYILYILLFICLYIYLFIYFSFPFTERRKNKWSEICSRTRVTFKNEIYGIYDLSASMPNKNILWIQFQNVSYIYLAQLRHYTINKTNKKKKIYTYIFLLIKKQKKNPTKIKIIPTEQLWIYL